MARIFIDGFESGRYDLWDSWNGSYPPDLSTGITGMDGTYCLNLQTLSSKMFAEKIVPDDDEYYCAFKWRTTSFDNNSVLSVWDNVGNLHTYVKIGPTFHYEAWRGPVYGGTQLGIASQLMSINTTYLVEIYMKISDSVGRCVVKIDGTTVLNYTGDTQNGTNAFISAIRLGCADLTWSNGYGYFDNFVLDDANWIGDTKIQAVVPTGIGTTTQWTPSSGDNYTCVDEIPASDIDFVETNTVDLVDTYVTANLTGSIGSIKCVQVQTRCIKEGAPTPLNLDLTIRSGGTNYFSADKIVGTAYKSLSNIWENDPATAVAWLESGVNAAEIGIKSKT